jgi:hypothetical protein
MNSDADVSQLVRPARADFWRQLKEVSSPIRWADILVFALILGLGAWQFYSVERAKDFLSDDVIFADAAHSVVQHGFYGINGYPETNMPPGTSWIIAALSFMGGTSHAALLRTMAVFAVLGFMATYELLRRQLPRVVAAAVCLLLISSQVHFEFVTQGVWPCYPYFFTATSALLVAGRLEKAKSLAPRIFWGVLLAVCIVASLMFASAGMAFLGAIVASTAVLFFRNRPLAFSRLKLYLGVLLVGIVAQGLWMHQPVEASAGISAAEWPVAGFPHSYVAQLKLKDGRDPELGLATVRDIPVRILKNAYEHANLLSQMLLQRWIYLAWMSIATFGMLLLIAIGWCYSMWPSGGRLQDWYFGGYEFIYLLWPWGLEPRFFLPVAPLACLYAWRGGEALVLLAKVKPRLLGLAWFPLSILLAVHSWFWMHGIGRAGNLPHAGLQDETSFVVWLLSAFLAAWMVWADTSWMRPAVHLRRSIGTFFGKEPSLTRIAQVLAMAVVLSLLLIGVKRQIAIGHTNMDLNSATNRITPDAEAGEWVRDNTERNAVVMARHVPTVFHYSGRNVIWFPPSSNPQLLMDGILRHRVNFVLVVKRPFNYYLPPDNDCFDPLLAAYPDAFRSVYQSPEFKVFEVLKNSPPPSQAMLGGSRSR